jgi:molybdenum cofactor cytidylyltransferase
MAEGASAPGRVGAVILGAGMSRRMGQPKLLLPWGETTVIGQIVRVLHGAGIRRPTLVTGAVRERVESALAGQAVELVENTAYASSEMLDSLRLGLAAQAQTIAAVLVVLGDQPAIEEGVVRQVVEAYQHSRARLVAPSYQHRRGHPWLVQRELWPEIGGLGSQATLRDFLNRHADEIAYVEVDSPGILKDIDTPQDYLRERPPTSEPPE